MADDDAAWPADAGHRANQTDSANHVSRDNRSHAVRPVPRTSESGAPNPGVEPGAPGRRDAARRNPVSRRPVR